MSTIYPGVPTTDWLLEAGTEGSTSLAIPKSVIIRLPSSRMSMFSGFRSLKCKMNKWINKKENKIHKLKDRWREGESR